MKDKLGQNYYMNIDLRNYNENKKISLNDNIFQKQHYKINSFENYNTNLTNQHPNNNSRLNKFINVPNSKLKYPDVNKDNNNLKKTSLNKSFDKSNSKNRHNINLSPNKYFQSKREHVIRNYRTPDKEKNKYYNVYQINSNYSNKKINNDSKIFSKYENKNKRNLSEDQKLDNSLVNNYYSKVNYNSRVSNNIKKSKNNKSHDYLSSHYYHNKTPSPIRKKSNILPNNESINKNNRNYLNNNSISNPNFLNDKYKKNIEKMNYINHNSKSNYNNRTKYDTGYNIDTGINALYEKYSNNNIKINNYKYSPNKINNEKYQYNNYQQNILPIINTNNTQIYKKINLNRNNKSLQETDEKLFNNSISNIGNKNKYIRSKENSIYYTYNNTFSNIFEDTSNFDTSNISRTGKNMETIEELHLAFVMMIQNSKKFMNIQENTNRDNNLNDNNPNSTVVKIDEKILN